jgi:hypothetical protein
VRSYPVAVGTGDSVGDAEAFPVAVMTGAGLSVAFPVCDVVSAGSPVGVVPGVVAVTITDSPSSDGAVVALATGEGGTVQPVVGVVPAGTVVAARAVAVVPDVAVAFVVALAVAFVAAVVGVFPGATVGVGLGVAVAGTVVAVGVVAGRVERIRSSLTDWTERPVVVG